MKQKSTILIQTVLRRRVDGPSAGNHYVEMTTWLPKDKRVKIGTIITLHGDEQKTKWTVHQQLTEIEARLINRRWNVGGLQ